MLGAASIVVEVDAERAAKRLKAGAVDALTDSVADALAGVGRAMSERRAWSVALVGNAADVFPAIAAGPLCPDVVTDQTAAHDLLYGYVPQGYTPADARRERERESGAADRRRPALDRIARRGDAQVQGQAARSFSITAT